MTKQRSAGLGPPHKPYVPCPGTCLGVSSARRSVRTRPLKAREDFREGGDPQSLTTRFSEES